MPSGLGQVRAGTRVAGRSLFLAPAQGAFCDAMTDSEERAVHYPELITGASS